MGGAAKADPDTLVRHQAIEIVVLAHDVTQARRCMLSPWPRLLASVASSAAIHSRVAEILDDRAALLQVDRAPSRIPRAVERRTMPRCPNNEIFREAGKPAKWSTKQDAAYGTASAGRSAQIRQHTGLKDGGLRVSAEAGGDAKGRGGST